MHSPSLITPFVADELINSYRADAARAQRPGRAAHVLRFRGRRTGALRPAAPRGRPLPPIAG